VSAERSSPRVASPGATSGPIGSWNNGETTFTIQVAPGEDATYVACHIVKPIIQRRSTPDAHSLIYVSTFGLPAADETTPCGRAESVPSRARSQIAPTA
jgi:hypothetical protein